MPSVRQVAEQLKHVGYGTISAANIAKVLKDGETIHAACGGPLIGTIYLITNKRLVALKTLKFDYDCIYANVKSIKIASDDKSLLVTSSDGVTHDIQLRKPDKAREAFVATIQRGLKSKVVRPSSAITPAPIGATAPKPPAVLVSSKNTAGAAGQEGKSKKNWFARHKVATVMIVLLSIWAVSVAASSNNNGTVTPTSSTIATKSSVTPTPTPTSTPKPASTPAPTPLPTPAPAPTQQAAAPTTTSQSCTPLSDEGTCYKPGEYCRDSDHGASGISGEGETITCEDNNGWRWEAS